MTRFSGKIIVVTGGRTGIGAAIANRFINEGARVFTAQRQPDDNHEHVITDLKHPDAPQKLIDTVIAKTGKLDVLVNNAGMMVESSIEDMSADSWMSVLNTNLTAPFLLMKAAMPYLRQNKGAIVNIGSIEGLGANPLHAAYAASKAGLHGLTKAVAIDHGHEGVRCNAVAPGWIDTALNEDFINAMEDPVAFRRDIGKIHPVGRTGTADEIAALVCFLASHDASFITGQIYTADGGRMAKLSLP